MEKFCEETGCEIQKMVDGESDEELPEDFKKLRQAYYCNESQCKRTAYQFHQWMKENNYKLVKEEKAWQEGKMTQ